MIFVSLVEDLTYKPTLFISKNFIYQELSLFQMLQTFDFPSDFGRTFSKLFNTVTIRSQNNLAALLVCATELEQKMDEKYWFDVFKMLSIN